MELDFYQSITIALLAGIPISVGLIRFIQKTLQRVARNSKASFRIKKAILVLANRLDDIDVQQHGKSHNLGPEIELLLKDD